MARVGCRQLYKYRTKTLGVFSPETIRLTGSGYEYINYHVYHNLYTDQFVKYTGMKIGSYYHGWWLFKHDGDPRKIKYYLAHQKQVRIHLGRREIRVNRLNEFGETRHIHYCESELWAQLFVYENKHRSDVYSYSTKLKVSHYHYAKEKICKFDCLKELPKTLIERYRFMMSLPDKYCQCRY